MKLAPYPDAPIGVVGAGTWGTALAIQLASTGHRVVLRGRSASLMAAIAADRRNPIYLSVVLLYVGITLLFAACWSLVLLVPALIIRHYAVILREEAYLDRRFGETYRQYRARVRRWI